MQELESRVCGRKDFDVELLRRNTAYIGLPPACTCIVTEFELELTISGVHAFPTRALGLTGNELHVQHFWKALQKFTPQQRSAFLRFVWGRSVPSACSEPAVLFSHRFFALFIWDVDRSRLPAATSQMMRKFEVHSFESYNTFGVRVCRRCPSLGPTAY